LYYSQVYPTLSAETVRYTLEHSESKMVFIGKLDEKPWAEMIKGVPTKGVDLVSFPLCPKDTMSAKTWADVITPCAPIMKPVKRTKDEMATIIYTSGSTGKPKGVMTSFMAMTDTSKGITKVMNINSEDRYLSYLPIAHGMERWLGMVRKYQLFCRPINGWRKIKYYAVYFILS
jgi:long-chain acyl-CoA synthetase